MLLDQSTRIAVGIMTGTSLDGIDACALRLQGRGMKLRAEHLGFASLPLDELADTLRRLSMGEPASARSIAMVRTGLGSRCSDAVDQLGLDRIDLIAVHGQTVHHDRNGSWQLIDPTPIAQRHRCAVVNDLRSLDRAAGGEGAPITPMADWILHRGGAPRAIVNLGGFINCTLLPAEHDPDPCSSIDGFDVCPCNHLLDAIARSALDCAFDEDGAMARSGSTCMEQLTPLVARLSEFRKQERSLGTGDEDLARMNALADTLGGADAAATTCAAIATTLARSLQPHAVHEVLLAGGGALNRTLVEAIGDAMGDDAVVGRLEHGTQREAAAMAVLGALAWDGIAITLPSVTGRADTHARDGSWVLPMESLDAQTP